MQIRQMTPEQANETLSSSPNAVYIDVRTEGEFERGHPPGALNVPVVFFDPAGGPAKPNPVFLDVVRRHVGVDKTVLLGCQSGARSGRAAEVLVRAGYDDVTNVHGGFGGARDRSGNVVVRGWRDAGLPVETGQPDGRSYTDLIER
jgi:rhodanese-related sulfurtransferase